MMKFTKVNDVVLHYTDEGNRSGPALVFINSLGSELRIWDDVAAHFATDYRIIRHDKRGHGLSECPPPPYTIRQHTLDLLGLLDQLEVEQATFIGISVGGIISIDLATHAPERVQKLVLCDTAAKIGNADIWNERIDTLRANGMAHLGDAILERWFTPQFAAEQPDARQGYYSMLTRTPVDGYTGVCEAIRDADLRPVLPDIGAKTLVLCGAEDLATTPDDATKLADAIAGASCKLIPNAAHLPCIEQPAAMITEIDQFLSTD